MVHIPSFVGTRWFNSTPLTSSELEGKVVLADFWTYSCVNCLRTLPYLRSWWQKYNDKGLVIVGVHTPEFDFEKDPHNVEQAVKELNVSWPVVMDNDFLNWNNFANHYWPAKYIADRSGKIVYEHFGEGSYEETEKIIQNLLAQKDSTMPLIDTKEHDHGPVCFIPTPELYCGYSRGFISNSEDYHSEKEYTYPAPAVIPSDSIALSGKFFASKEYVESREIGADILLRFHATEVNLVMATEGEAVVRISYNGEKLPVELRGGDVSKDSTVVIAKARLYTLLKSNDLLDGLLSIKAKKGNFQAFAFTFSGCTK